MVNFPFLTFWYMISIRGNKLFGYDTKARHMIILPIILEFKYPQL